MNLNKMLVELMEERRLLDLAIARLEQLASMRGQGPRPAARKQTAAAREEARAAGEGKA